ncbi:MAG: hypothetical protein OEW08_12260 [Gammaproteobacteria bacterium]|nr:hypothetical protein [Gammaproteobacteria bacterium]
MLKLPKGKKGWTKAIFLTTLVGLTLLILVRCVDWDDDGTPLEDRLVKIELGGQRFNVPVRYMYGETVAKWNTWRKPKKGRTHVDYLNVSLLTPKLFPYYAQDDARWKVLGHGERIQVSFIKWSFYDGWVAKAMESEEKSSKKGLSQKIDDIHGLIRYERNDNYYLFSIDESVKIYCGRPGTVPFPSCSVRSEYKNGLGFNYYYSAQYLPRWREIDHNIKALFEKFGQAAEASERSLG